VRFIQVKRNPTMDIIITDTINTVMIIMNMIIIHMDTTTTIMETIIIRNFSKI